MFKPDLWQSHNEYRTLVTVYGRRLSRNNPKYAFDLYGTECQKLLNLNLDAIMEYIAPFYSSGGRPAKNQAQILRSLILFVLLFNKTPAKTCLTAWVKDVLPRSISLTVLAGCTSAGELPAWPVLWLHESLLDGFTQSLFQTLSPAKRQEQQKARQNTRR